MECDAERSNAERRRRNRQKNLHRSRAPQPHPLTRSSIFTSPYALSNSCTSKSGLKTKQNFCLEACQLNPFQLDNEAPRGGAILSMPAAVHREPIILGAARNNLPAVYWQSPFARDGGLLSYGRDLVDAWRRAASYVDRILRGEKPGDLPVQFPTKFEMVVNRKTATALGLAIPPSIMLRADEVIE
jgi:hypothetical protein